MDVRNGSDGSVENIVLNCVKLRNKIKKMAEVNPFCVFCHKSTSKLKSFSKESLCKCSKILTIRKNNNLVGKEAILPAQPNDFQLYHSECYRRFTALPPKYRDSTSKVASSSSIAEQPIVKDDDISRGAEFIENIDIQNPLSCENVDTSQVSRAPELAEDVECAAEAESDFESAAEHVFTCFFCEKTRKKVKGREEKLSLFSISGCDSIKDLAKQSDDLNMMQNIEKLSLDQEHFYHKSCKNVYITARKSALSKDKEKSEWHFTRDIRAEAYDLVENFVAENIIKNEQSYFLKFLNDMFINHLENNHQAAATYTLKPYHLRDRLLKKFSKKIKILNFKGQSIVKPYKGIMVQNAIEEQNILDAAARILNEKINNIEPRKLTLQIKTRDLTDSECIVPESLIQFYDKVISGVNYRRRRHTKTKRL